MRISRIKKIPNAPLEVSTARLRYKSTLHAAVIYIYIYLFFFVDTLVLADGQCRMGTFTLRKTCISFEIDILDPDKCIRVTPILHHCLQHDHQSIKFEERCYWSTRARGGGGLIHRDDPIRRLHLAGILTVCFTIITITS